LSSLTFYYLTFWFTTGRCRPCGQVQLRGKKPSRYFGSVCDGDSEVTGTQQYGVS